MTPSEPMIAPVSRQVLHRFAGAGELSGFAGWFVFRHPHGQSAGHVIGIRPSGRNVPPWHFPPHGASGFGGAGGAGGVTSRARAA